MQLIRRSTGRLIVLLLSSSAATPALAQAVDDAPEAPQTQEEQERQNVVEQRSDIIVTAQRRPQTIVQVPMSIDVLRGEELAERGVDQFVDYAITVPSLSFGFNGAEARGSRNTIAIRGVSGTDTTGYYVDDTPLPYGVDPHLFDIDRIEILRGPQGTLYGAGSMGGTIKVLTREPNTRNFEGLGTAELSHTNEGSVNVSLGAALNIPIASDVAALRISFYHDYLSGVFDRVYGQPLPYYPEAPTALLSGVEKNFDSSRVTGGRAALLVKPAERLEVVASVYAQWTNEAGATQADTEPGNFDQFRTYNIQEPYKENYVLGNLTVRYDLGFADLTSSTSYFDRNWKEAEDITEIIDTFFRSAYANPDVAPFPLPIYNKRDQHRFVQELRIGSSTGIIDWFVGGFYQHVWTERKASLLATGMAANPDYIDFGVDDVFFVSTDSETTTEASVFGDVTAHLTERLDVSGGVRFSRTKVENDRVSGGLFDAGLNLKGLEQKENVVTPRAAVRYLLSKDNSVYASAAKGFRLGGTNTPLPSTCDPDLGELGIASPGSYNSDSLWSYEAGAKTKFAQGRIGVNAAAFVIKWDEIQQSVRLPRCGFNFVSNVGKAEIKGFEVELLASPTDELNLTFSASLNDSAVLDPGQGTTAEKGDWLLNTPRWKFAASAVYRLPVWPGREPFFRLDYSYFGRSFSTFNQDDPAHLVDPQPYLVRKPFQLVNARLGATFGNVETALFVTNLFNEAANLGDALSIGLDFPDRPRWITNRPRTIGVNATVNFR